MDGTNWYAYCNNDPVNFEDPNGTNPAAALAQQFLSSPTGQLCYQHIANLAAKTGTSIVNYVSQHLPELEQAATYIAQYGEAAWDWTTNTAAPWAAEKAQQAIQFAKDTAEKAKNWVKDKIDNVTNGDPNKKPSLKNVNNRTANDIAKKNGFEDAHAFKESIVGNLIFQNLISK